MGHVEHEGVPVQSLIKEHGDIRMSLMTPFIRKQIVPWQWSHPYWATTGNLIILIFVVLSHHPMMAQLPQARLDTVFPPGGQRGTELQVSLGGENLDGLRQLLFSHPGIRSEIKPSEPSSKTTPPSFRITISKNVPPGNYEVRTTGYFGVSNPRCFVVGIEKEISKEGNPNHIGASIDLPLETVINGNTHPQTIDHYAIHLAAGVSYTIECIATSIDSKLVPSLVLIDPNGKECARARSGGLIHYLATSNGRHFIKLHDTLFQGGAPFYYRLRVTKGPWIESLIPSTLMSEQRSPQTLNGRRLPSQMEIAYATAPLNDNQSLPLTFRTKPGDAEVDGFDWRFSTTHGISNPHFLTIATEPSVKEQEPNNTPDQPQKIQPPCEISGTLDTGHDVDRFQFEAKKGDVWWMEVVSNRIGQPTSPFLIVQRKETTKKNQTILHNIKEVYAQTKNPLGRHLDLSHRDPSWRFAAPQDGIYQIRLNDLFQHAGTSKTHPYRLRIRKPKPDFSLVTVSSHPTPIRNDARTINPSETLLRQGMTWPLEVAVIRRDGFQGAIELRTSDLPEGVRSNAGRIPEGEDRGWIFLTASSNTPSTWTPIKVKGRATIEGNEVIRRAKSATTLWSVGDYNNQPLAQRLVTSQWMATIDKETSPVVITPHEETVDAFLGKSMDIPLTVKWNEGAENGFKIKPIGIPSADKLPELEIKPPETSYTYKLNLSDLNLASGNYHLSWFGQTKIKYRNQAHVAELFKTRLQEADAQLAAAQSMLRTLEDKLAEADKTDEQQQETESQLEAARKTLKEAESHQAKAAQQSKESEERAKPRDVDWMVYAAPITLRLSPESPKEESK